MGITELKTVNEETKNDRLPQGNRINAIHRSKVLGRIVNGKPLDNANIDNLTVTTPETLRDPEQLQAFLHDENASGTKTGSIVFARPWWDHQEYLGKNSYAIFVELQGDEKLWHLLQIQRENDGRWIAVSPAKASSQLPVEFEPSNKCHKGSHDPAFAHTLCIYAVVEWVQMNYTPS